MSNPKIVSFDRSAAYLHHRAMMNRRENRVVDALELLRQAVERVIFEKPGEHCFEELAGVTEAAPMSAIGG